ncbi:hypothetical protein [Nonomuraea sp. bgisy101]|uniref:hypothetical protein n=1 Tax=Nonomuraea sp. bgisy101 TaxID=3413784 RepID=UPI003D753281
MSLPAGLRLQRQAAPPRLGRLASSPPGRRPSPRTGASAARLYWESFKQVQRRFAGANTDVVTVPTGCSIFPEENPRPSLRWAGRRFTDIRHWNELDRGGHFAAFEQPEL